MDEKAQKTSVKTSARSKSSPKKEAPSVVQTYQKVAIPSIKEALNKMPSTDSGIVAEPEIEGNPVEKINVSERNSNVFTEETLKAAMLSFAEKVKKDRPRVASYLKSHLPEKTSESQVSLKFQNSAQLEVFKTAAERDLLIFLHKELNNDFINLNLSLAESSEAVTPKLYTDKDKLKHMMDKNPSLLKLKQDFNLDFD